MIIVDQLPFSRDEELGWYLSPPLSLALVHHATCQLILDGYDDDEQPHDFEAVVQTLRAADSGLLKPAEAWMLHYATDMLSLHQEQDPSPPAIGPDPEHIWDHVHCGSEILISRRHHGDRAVHAALVFECDWEPEHGLQIVLRHGHELVRVSPCDGHLTNADAYADPRLETVIYVGLDRGTDH